jgi:thiamine kinase-like enzyme
LKKVKVLKQFHGGSMAKTFLIDKEGQKFVRKIVDRSEGHLGVEKLYKQWEWLFEFCQEQEGIFPNVSYFVSNKNYAYYDMEYIEMKTMRDVLLEQDEFDETILHDFLQCGSIIAEPTQIKNEGHEYIIKKHIFKMAERNKCISHYDFYKSEKISINGRVYDNLQTILEKMIEDEELLDFLSPHVMFRSHGDFTFQNILTDEEDLFVIDPRGEGLDPIYYDISKIYQSCHGKYDLLYEGNYKAAYQQAEVPEIYYGIKDNVEKFEIIFNEIRLLIPHYYEILDKDGKLEQNWELITKFYEASHFISMTPFRLKENAEIMLTCYAIGIQILNDFMEEWNNVKPKLGKQESTTV